jgi:hypothetical protein
MTLASLLAHPPQLHRTIEGDIVNMGLSGDALAFIDEHVGPQSRTLETGSGTSTVLFVLRGARHICITPSTEEVALLKDYCEANGIDSSRTSFICEPSELALPKLEAEPLDVVLIDGRHGFPAPMIDFFYTAGLLKVGGYLIIDDVVLDTCRYLRDVLAEQPEWEVTANLSRSSVLRKLAEGSEWTDWTHQPYVVRSSAASRTSQVMTHLRKGEFAELGGKVWGRLARTRHRR